MQVLLALGSLAVAVLGAEFVATFYLRSLESRDLAVFEAVAPDAGRDVLGVKSGYSQEWKASEFDVEVATNASGFREPFDFELGDVDVAFVGDSFTFGHGVDVGQRYSDVFGSFFPGERVAALSFKNGFAPPHYLFFFENHPELRPTQVVLGLFLGNDLESDIEETELHYDGSGKIASLGLFAREVSPGGSLINAIGSYRAFFDWLRRSSHLGKLIVRALNQSSFRPLLFSNQLGFTPNAPNSRSLEFGELHELALESLAAIEGLDQLVRERGGSLLVFFIPESFYVGIYPSNHWNHRDPARRLTRGEHIALRDRLPLNKRLLRWCAERSVACLDSTSPLRRIQESGRKLYFTKDGHWTPQGHRAAAILLRNYRRERMQ